MSVIYDKLTSLPSSPYWNNYKYKNADNQIDGIYDKEKMNEFKLNLKLLIYKKTNFDKTKLENMVEKKRYYL